MPSLDYGLDIPYEVQLEHHAATSTTHMTILEPQRSPGQPATRHLLTPGVYMVSLAYNGAAAATLQHVGGGTTNAVSVAEVEAGMPRTSAPMKISVQGTTEYLHVASPSTGGTARATISVIPAATFDEMAESAQGVSVLSEISNLKATKADKSTLDARVPANTSLRLDTSVGTRIFAGDTMIYGDTGRRSLKSVLSNGWTAGTIDIRRENSLVIIDIWNLNGEAATGNKFITLPNGLDFGSSGQHFEIGSTSVAYDPVDKSLSLPLGTSYFVGVISQSIKRTDNGWPTSLPGTPS